MKLRALQSTQIQTLNGPVFVNGPELNDKEEMLAPGQVVDVPDDFVVNPLVFEPVEQVGVDGKGEPLYRALGKGDPRLKRVQFAKLPKEMRAPEQQPATT